VLSIVTESTTLNNHEWPLCTLTACMSTLTNHEILNEDRPILSAEKMGPHNCRILKLLYYYCHFNKLV